MQKPFNFDTQETITYLRDMCDNLKYIETNTNDPILKSWVANSRNALVDVMLHVQYNQHQEPLSARIFGNEDFVTFSKEVQ